MKLIGYAREGRSSETLEQQVHCLMDYGLNIENIFKREDLALMVIDLP